MSKASSFKVWKGDCMALLSKHVPDASVDMILCDLPYGITQNKWDTPLPLDDLWDEYRRVCPQGAIVLFAGTPFDEDPAGRALLWTKPWPVRT